MSENSINNQSSETNSHSEKEQDNKPTNKGTQKQKDSAKEKRNDVTMLQIVAKKRRGGDNAKTSQTRAKFLQAFEETFGNISASCEFAGIARLTFYRWMKSTTPVNRKFQKRVAALKPIERQLDFVEGMLMQRVAAGDTTAIIFALKTKGKHRGYAEKTIEADQPEHSKELAQLIEQISTRARQRGVSYKHELDLYLQILGSDIKPEIKLELVKTSPNNL